METIGQLEFKANGRLELSRGGFSLVFSSTTYIKPLIVLGILFLTGCGVISGTKFDGNDALQPGGDLYSDDARASYQPIYVRAPRPVNLPHLTIPNNPEVQKELHRLLGRERRFVERSLRRQQEYESTLEDLLADEGVPSELLALAMVESSLDNKAKSRAGAVGMWQFMKTTAREYDLRVDFFHDERTDPVLSTIAAARMLQKLYTMFGNWELVLAAYNCGYGGVKRHMKRAGETDFWKMSRRGFFNRETRTFVPRVLALATILKDPKKYGF